LAVRSKRSQSRASIASVVNRPYRRESRRNADGTWFARIVEFEGCMTEGDTEKEALEHLDDALRGWVKIKLSLGAPIPEPNTP